MSIADHFDDRPDAGFTRRYDERTAQRQFKVSAALVLVLGLASLALAILARHPAPSSPDLPTSFDAGRPGIVERMLDIQG